jgi:hypothetical protein
MLKSDEMTEQQRLDLVIIIIGENGGTIERLDLLNKTEFYEEELDDYMETLRLRGLITFTRGLHTLRDQDMEGWMVASLTEEGFDRINECEKDIKQLLSDKS